MRGLFFAPPGGPRPTPPATADPRPARALRDAIEPLACLSIWSPEAAEGYAAAGLDDYFAAYVWQRAAPLGTPPAALAVAALGVFAPDLITPQYEKGVAALSRDDVIRARHPVEMNVLTELYCGYPLGAYTASRGWDTGQIDAAAARLRGRGLLDDAELSADGLRHRGELEARTDAMAQSVVDAIGPDLDTLTKQLCGWSDALVAAGAAPPDPAKRAAG